MLLITNNFMPHNQGVSLVVSQAVYMEMLWLGLDLYPAFMSMDSASVMLFLLLKFDNTSDGIQLKFISHIEYIGCLPLDCHHTVLLFGVSPLGCFPFSTYDISSSSIIHRHSPIIIINIIINISIQPWFVSFIFIHTHRISSIDS